MEETQTISLTPEIKDHWNGFVDHLEGDYPTAGALSEYNGKNPKSQLTEAHIPAALDYISSIKQNPNIQGLTPAYKAGNNMRFPVTQAGGHIDVGEDPKNRIPAPDYKNPQSRLAYAKQFSQKYGPLVQGRGDTPLRLNEKPEGASDSAKNIAINATKSLGIKPELLYSSAMEEGMSGMFPDKNSDVDWSGDNNFPVNGYVNFGLDTISDKIPKLKKKGYLPADFDSQYSPKEATNELGQKVNSANFKSPEAAMQAKAAVMKDAYDQLDEYAKKKGIPLSDKARDFFVLAMFNAGDTGGKKMLQDYADAGALKDDQFLKERPKSGKNLKETSWKEPYNNTMKRIRMAEALKGEGLF